MIPFFVSPLTCLSAFFRSRYNLGLEILALRQQLGILKRKIASPSTANPGSNILDPAPPPLACMEQHPDHRQTDTVVAWHRAGFRCSGAFARAERALAGQRSMPRLDLSSGGW
jgi:hypothetical protein